MCQDNRPDLTACGFSQGVIAAATRLLGKTYRGIDILVRRELAPACLPTAKLSLAKLLDAS